MSAASRPGDSVPVDRQLLGIYLNDHLAGAVAGSGRMRRTADTLARTPVGPALDRVAREVAEERETLRGLIEELGFAQAWPKQVATWVGEHVGRLKLNGRIVRPSPLTALLEIEILRSAVTGKRGLWQTLADEGAALGVEPEMALRLLEQTDAQLEALDAAHAYVRSRALRGGAGEAAG